MFDSYTVRAVTERVTQNVNVTEKRAPTDESVRLLREMEGKAKESILSSTRVTGMGIDCVVHKMADHMNARTRFAVIYSLNGKKHRVDYEHDDLMGDPADDHEKLICGLIRKVGEHMAVNLLAEPFSKAMADARWR